MAETTGFVPNWNPRVADGSPAFETIEIKAAGNYRIDIFGTGTFQVDVTYARDSDGTFRGLTNSGDTITLTAVTANVTGNFKIPKGFLKFTASSFSGASVTATVNRVSD